MVNPLNEVLGMYYNTVVYTINMLVKMKANGCTLYDKLVFLCLLYSM